ncbi:response regulator transcription factor [Cohnella silvisoli]|uniref:Helix-turn-helix domain-containing protein n=1 Tax=Cohnella silvisoli TaxID=2873699 RepID=A0ABV1KRE5_9BACL|nr:helix-turn-helix domain-containing protein [Cohnella silvisoli]MCD9021676.1 helix-turn-helix domain-containing protein [Cohnella silvisoli]
MYSLLIIDDEQYALDGMVEGIDWEGIGITRVWTALNVNDARKLLVSQSVDVVLVDIEMPGENGLSFLEWLNQQGLRIKSIVLTGHARFDYAQQAMKAGGQDYMLKPVDLEELKQAVLKAIVSLQTEREYEQFEQLYESYKQMWKVERPLLVERFWCNVIDNRISPTAAQLNTAFTSYGIPLTGNDSVIPILISVEFWHKELNAQDEEIMEYALKKAAEEIVLQEEDGDVIRDGTGILLLLVYQSANKPFRSQEWRARCEAYIRSCNEYFHCDLSCYLGCSIPLSELPTEYKQLLAVERNNLQHMNAVLSTESLGERALNTRNVVPSVVEWIPLLEMNKEREVLGKLDNYLSQMEAEGGGSDALETLYFGVVYMLLSVQVKKGLSTQMLMNLISEQNKAIRSVERFRQWAQRAVKVSIQLRNAEGLITEPYSDIVLHSMAFIHAHFAEDINRGIIANSVFINPAYLSRLFRKETGKTLTEYVQSVRMDHARTLLDNDGKSVSEASLQSGFPNLPYFSKVFKQYYGVTPQEYRTKRIR